MINSLESNSCQLQTAAASDQSKITVIVGDQYPKHTRYLKKSGRSLPVIASLRAGKASASKSMVTVPLSSRCEVVGMVTTAMSSA